MRRKGWAVLLTVSIVMTAAMPVFAIGTSAVSIEKRAVKNEIVTFTEEEFAEHYIGTDLKLKKIQISGLPNPAVGELKLRNKLVAEFQEIKVSDIKRLNFTPARDYVGYVEFIWNGATSNGYARYGASVRIVYTDTSTLSRYPSDENPPLTATPNAITVTPAAEKTPQPGSEKEGGWIGKLFGAGQTREGEETPAPDGETTPDTEVTPGTEVTPDGEATPTPDTEETPGEEATPTPDTEATPEGEATPTPDSEATPTPETPSEPPLYADLNRHFAEYSAGKLYSENIWVGERIGEKRFMHPQQQVNRIEFVMLILSALGETYPDGNTDPVFADEAEYQQWVLDAGKYAYKKGIIKGSLEGDKLYLHAFDIITRAEAAQIVMNTLSIEVPEYRVDLEFADQSEIPLWAADAIRNLRGYGIINGYEDNTFRPLKQIPRADTIEIIWQFRKFITAEGNQRYIA